MLISLLIVVSPLTVSMDPNSAWSVQEPLVAAVAVEDYKSLLKAAGDDPDKLWALYEWTLEEDDRKKYRKRVLNKIIKVAPDHAEAHAALGHVLFEGKWFDSERALDRHMSKLAKERGLVKYDGKWVAPTDVPFLDKGWMKDARTGEWYDPVARERLAEGWKLQDLNWVSPDEVSKLDEGLWKCDDKWLTLDEADEWHGDIETPWRIPTKRATVWSTGTRATALKAAAQAEQAYFDMLKVFGFGGDGQPAFMVVRSQAEYLRFMDGSEDYDLPQLDPLAMSAFNRSAFADLWFDFDEEVYLGMGVTFWDGSNEAGDLYGVHDARFAYGLSFVESIDPCVEGLDEVYGEGEVTPEFAAVRLSTHSLPRWFRWGAACYASRWFKDNQVKRGGNPYWASQWSASNLKAQGGLLDFDDVFEFQASGQNEETARLINQAGLMVAFLVDGGDATLSRLHEELQGAMEKRQDTEKIFGAIRKALSERDEQIRAFMNK
ncbi:MAG: hypothetical protein P8M11_06200 [Planctomycetota bacterium]|nr:hypothetical protein [Planctomycetota bacterium]